MIRLLISWPSSPAPLLESNASSWTSYASKKNNLHIKFPNIRALVHRTSGGDVFTESEVNGTPGDGRGGARRGGEVAWTGLSNPHLCNLQASAWASLLLSTPLIIQEEVRHQPQRPRHSGFPPMKGSPHCSWRPVYLFVSGPTTLDEWSPPPGGADGTTLLFVRTWRPPRSLAPVLNSVYCLNRKQAREAMRCSGPSPPLLPQPPFFDKRQWGQAVSTTTETQSQKRRDSPPCLLWPVLVGLLVPQKHR